MTTKTGVCSTAAQIIYKDVRPLSRLRAHLETCEHCDRASAVEFLGTAALSPKTLRKNPIGVLLTHVWVAQALAPQPKAFV